MKLIIPTKIEEFHRSTQPRENSEMRKKVPKITSLANTTSGAMARIQKVGKVHGAA
jgi:hypothetical protein